MRDSYHRCLCDARLGSVDAVDGVDGVVIAVTTRALLGDYPEIHLLVSYSAPKKLNLSPVRFLMPALASRPVL